MTEIASSGENSFALTVHETDQVLTLGRNTFPFFVIIAVIAIISIPFGIQGFSGFHPSYPMGIYLIVSIFSAMAFLSLVAFHPTRRIVELDLGKDSVRVNYLVFGRYLFNAQSKRLSDASDIRLIIQPYHNSSAAFSSMIAMRSDDHIHLLESIFGEEENRRILDLIHKKTGLQVSVITEAVLYPG